MIPRPASVFFWLIQRPATPATRSLRTPRAAHIYLLIPTETMAGVDSSELLDPETPNYFAKPGTRAISSANLSATKYPELPSGSP